MIIYQPGYLGLHGIRSIVAELSGGNGNGSPDLPFPLHILGKNLGIPVGLQVGAGSNHLVNFLRAKTQLDIARFLPEDDPDIPFVNWVSFDADTRASVPETCARIIIMAYLSLHQLIDWQQQPQLPQ